MNDDFENPIIMLTLPKSDKDIAKEELETLLSSSDQREHLLSELNLAQWHYTDLIGITVSGCFDNSQLELERKSYAGFMKQSDGLIVFEDDKCALFMSSVHNLPLPLCAAYVISEAW